MRGFYPENLFNSDFYLEKQSVVIDLKGFTKTCSKYIQEDIYGLEKISNLINELFNPVIDEIYKLNGEVLSFSGDAMLVAIAEKDINKLKENTDTIIKRYNKKKKNNIGIHFNILPNKYFPFTLKSQPYFFYYPLKTTAPKIEIKIPHKIKEIHKSMFKGELRIVPISFVHVKENISPDKIINLINSISRYTQKHGIYINKIEFLDKGWIILLSSGLPFYINNATLHLYEFLKILHKEAEKRHIPLSSSITVQKEYCGIIGNDKRWEYTFIGHGVNMAARMAVKEKSGQIVHDEYFYKINKEVFTFTSKEEEYKGIGKATVFLVKSRKKQQKKEIFIGREKEIEISLSTLSNPFNFILIYGPSGIGKTYLVKHILKETRTSTLFLRGDSNAQSPLSLFENTEFSKNITSRKEIQQYFNNIKEKTIIFIDDLQFADNQSLEVIKWMLSVNNSAVNFIATSFTNKIINKIKPPLTQYKITEIELKPFTEKDIKEIIAQRLKSDVSYKVIKKIVKVSKGNPLFVNYIIDTIKEDFRNIPYNIEEIIFSKIEKLPEGGNRFINDASIYGDVFNKVVISNIENIKKKQLNNIENKGYEEGLIERERSETYLRFQNNIIRETVFSSILKKEIDYIRNQIAEELLKERGINPKTCDFFYLTGNVKFLDIVHKLIEEYIKKENYHAARNYLIKAMKFIKEKKLYSQGLSFIKQISEIPSIYLNNKAVELSKHIILKIENFNGEEKLLLKIAEIIASIQFEYSKVESLVERYKAIKGEDYYYTWKKLMLLRYGDFGSYNIIDIFNELLRKIEDKNEKIEFLLDYVSLMFFRFGLMQYVNKGLKKLKRLEKDMSVSQKNEYYQLLSSLSLHYDKIEDALKYLEKTNYKNRRYSLLTQANDLAIIYFHLGIKNLDTKMIKKSLKYAEKSYNFVKDEGIYSLMPLITTNLGTSYITISNIKKGINLYYEGLKYGEHIKHPVEVPFTKSRIALFAYSYGAKKLAYQLANEILNGKMKVDDLLPLSLTLLYIKQDDEKYLKEGLKIANELANAGIPKCFWEITRLLLDSVLLYDRKEFIELLYKHLPIWNKQYQTRHFTAMMNEINILLLKYLIKKDKITKKKLLAFAEKLQSINLGYKTLSIIYYLIDENEEYFKKAYKYSQKAYIHPLSTKILKILSKSSSYYKNKLKREKDKLKEIEQIKTVKQLVDFINEKD